MTSIDRGLNNSITKAVRNINTASALRGRTKKEGTPDGFNENMANTITPQRRTAVKSYVRGTKTEMKGSRNKTTI